MRKIGICSRRFRSREDPEDGRFAALALRSHDRASVDDCASEPRADSARAKILKTAASRPWRCVLTTARWSTTAHRNLAQIPIARRS